MTTDCRIGILSSEPVLSARFMQMANSAAMNPGGTPVASLNNAVNRLGFNLVRTVATAFALRQLSRDSSLGDIRSGLELLTRLLSAAKLRHQLEVEPELWVKHPDAEHLLGSVNLGKGSFMHLMAVSQSDIANMQQALAA